MPKTHSVTLPASGLPGVAALQRRYAIELLEDEEDGGYTVLCPSLPGLVTQGDTIAECRERAEEAILCHLGALVDLGLPIPPSDSDQQGKILISVRLD